MEPQGLDLGSVYGPCASKQAYKAFFQNVSYFWEDMPLSLRIEGEAIW